MDAGTLGRITNENVKSKIIIMAHICLALSTKPVWYVVYMIPFSLHRSLQTSSVKFLRVNPSVCQLSCLSSHSTLYPQPPGPSTTP